MRRLIWLCTICRCPIKDARLEWVYSTHHFVVVVVIVVVFVVVVIVVIVKCMFKIMNHLLFTCCNPV